MKKSRIKKKGSHSKKSCSFSDSLSGHGLEKLTPSEREIYALLIGDYLTVTQISNRRKTGRRYTQHCIKKFKDMGLIDRQNRPLRSCGYTGEPNKRIRLHYLGFRANLLHFDERYINNKEKSNIRNYGPATVRLCDKSVVIYYFDNHFASTAEKAFIKAHEQVTRLIRKIENDLCIELLKPRKDNLKMFACHVSEINNGLAKMCNINEEKVTVYCNDNGKLWFQIDNSFNLNEAECIGQSAIDNMQDIVSPFFNDLKDNRPPKTSEIWSIVAAHVKSTKVFQDTMISLLTPKEEHEPMNSTSTNAPDYIG